MKDLSKIYIDLSKCSEEQQNYIFSLLPPRKFDNQYRIDPYHFRLSFDDNSEWWVFNNTLGKTELTYPEFIKLFEEPKTVTESLKEYFKNTPKDQVVKDWESVSKFDNVNSPKVSELFEGGEEWRPCVGYEGLYEVSNLGNIKSLPKELSNGNGLFISKEKIMKPYKDKDGYSTVNLYLDKIRKSHKVHRLIATSFIPNPENKKTVNHINSIRDDNRVENLEWATYSENNQHAFDHGNQRPMKGNKCWLYDISSENHPNAKKVINLQNGRIYECLKDATKDLGLKYSNVLSKINLTQKGYNDTGLVFLDDLKDIPQEIKVRVGTTIFEYELKQKSEWIKVESESDLPKEVGDYWAVWKDGEVGRKQFFCRTEKNLYSPNGNISEYDWWMRHITHYQPIVKPEPPKF